MPIAFAVAYGARRVSCACVDYQSALNWARDFARDGDAHPCVIITYETNKPRARIALDGSIVEWTK